MTNTRFDSQPLPPALLANLADLGYEQMTPIQAQTLPLALAGRDLIAQAKTGSGKTAAFSIPVLTALNPRFFGVQALVMCPTRELSTQVATEIRRIARYQENIKVVILCGGQSIGPQIGSLAHGAHIVVGTPGRIKDHLRKRTLDLSGVTTVVLDEADRMLDMGFVDDMRTILEMTPRQRQTLLFSATFPDNIESLSHDFQTDPQRITVAATHTATAIKQQFFVCSHESKIDDLMSVLQHIRVATTVIFCNTRQTARDVATTLDAHRFNARALHGELDQRERDQVLTRFKQGSLSILVATDVAARGLDVDDLPAVINFDLPKDPEVYTHRVGRTARAGKAGIAVSLVRQREIPLLERLVPQLEPAPVLEAITSLSVDRTFSMLPERTTLEIAGGRKHKIRPGDILGALTQEADIPGSAVGKIDISEFNACVSINNQYVDKALGRLLNGKIKGRRFKVRKI